MANQTQDVELRIRASNFSKQTTDQVVDALKNMTKAQDAQIESAKNGTTTVAQLESSYQKLESAAKALLGQQSLIKLFQSQTATLTELETKVQAARRAQQDFNNTLTPGAEITKKQKSEMDNLARAVASAEKQYDRAQGRIETTQKRMADFGVTAASAAEAQNKIVAAINGTNAALERQDAAINSNDAHAASRKAAADAIAQREQQVKVDNIFAQAERDVANALQTERAAQVAANQAAADKSRERQVEVDVLFANAQRDAAEALNRKTAALVAQKAALQAAANEAERMARGTVNTARGSAPVSTPNLTGQIRDIANPADAAVRSVDGIEAAVARLETRVAAIRGPVQDYRGAIEETTRAQRALLAVAGQVDAYQRQIAAVRAARGEYTDARTAVNRLIAEMRSGNAGDDVTTRLARAQGTLQQTATRLGSLTTAAREMRTGLQTAGVDTTNLANAEASLVGQANRATTALNALNSAYQRNGAAADNAGSRIWNWFGGNGGRTTLSYMQRMRGELIGMAAGFVGLNASIDLAKKSLDAYGINQAIMSRLTIANGGDARAAGEDFKYLQVQADRIGFSFAKVAPAYTKYAIAARSAGFTTQQTRFSFEQIAASAVKARLSTDELEGVMKAFEQMMSKGTIQAEELRGQLGDRLPGAFQIAARAAGMTVEEFTKAVSLGQIGSDQVIKIARELGKTYGASEAGTAGLLEAQARFENAAHRFLTNTAAGGFVQSFTALLGKLTEMMNNGQADALAAQLSKAFGAVIDVFGFVADNIDNITRALEALIAVQVIKWLFTLPALFVAVRTEVVLLNAQMLALNAWMARTEAAAALTAALGTGGVAGVVARLTPLVMNLGRAMIFLGKSTAVLAAGYAAYQATRALVDMGDNGIRDQIQKSIEVSTQAMKDAEAAQVKFQQAKGTRDEARAKAEYDRLSQLAVDASKKQASLLAEAASKNVDLKANVAFASHKQAEASRATASPDGTPAGATADPGDPSGDRQRIAQLQKKLDAEDKKNQRQSALARLKSEKGDLAERLAIIREPFDELKTQYRAATKDDEEYQKAVAKIDASYAKAAAVERQKYENEQGKAGESAAKKRIALAAEIQMKIKEIEDDIAKRATEADPTEPFETRRLARVKAIGNAYDQVMKKIIQEKGLNPTQAAADEKKLKALIEQRKELENQNSFRDEANRLLDDYNKKQGILNTNVGAIKAQAEAGMIPQAVAVERINEQIKLLGPGIDAAGQKTLEFTVMAANMIDPTRFAEIVATISQGMAKNNVDASVAVNSMNEAQRQMNEMLAMQQREIEKINLLRKLGTLDANQEVDALNTVTAKYAQSIQFTAQQFLNFIAIVRAKGGMSPDQLASLEAAANTVLATSQAGIVQAKEWESTMVSSIAQNGVSAFDAMAQSIGKVITGQQGIAEGFHGMLQASAQFFSSLLKDIAMAMLRMAILKALQGVGGGIGSAATFMLGGKAQHTGGVTGMNASFTRNVPADAYMGAARYHTGGIAGFAPNEVPAVLQKGEEVLTRDDPRHILNGGTQAAQGGGSNRFVLVDDRSRVPQAMASSEGEKVTLVHLKNNLPTLRQWLKP
jgi:tape measure domain-containing protein